MEKVLILGIGGFTGRHFLDFTLKNELSKEFFFVGADKKTEKVFGIESREINLLDREEFERLILEIEPDYIMNFSGIFGSNKFSELEEINAGISKNMFESIVRNKLMVKKILLIGSAAEYGKNSELPIKEEAKLDPVTPYGLSKVAQTMYANHYFSNHGINLNIARTFNVVGKYLSPELSVSSFADQIRKARNGDTIFVGNLSTKRDFLDIDDVVCAYWKILLHGKSGQIYNVCSGKSSYMKDVLDFLVNKSGKNISIRIKDEFVRKNDILDSYGDNSKLKRDTGWNESSDIFSSLSAMLEE